MAEKTSDSGQQHAAESGSGKAGMVTWLTFDRDKTLAPLPLPVNLVDSTQHLSPEPQPLFRTSLKTDWTLRDS